ncbi:MAG: Photosystem II reaction center X protein [Pseudanabaena sp.]|nr:MAG: Photosystem II reaction center X protein [Pseudanabaena sp.]
MTPSLMNFFLSLVAGAVVLGLIFAAVLLVSQKDKIVRDK